MSPDRLVVVFDRGGASAAEIGRGLGELGDLIFAVPYSRYTAELVPVLERLGEVIPLSGEPARDIAAVRSARPTAVLTFSEPMLGTTSVLAQALGLPHHSSGTTALLTDKVLQRSRLRDAGVDDVPHRPLASPDDWRHARAAVGLPAIVKPVHGEGSAETYVVHDDASATDLMQEMFRANPGARFIVEQFLEGRGRGWLGDYVSVESMCGPGGRAHFAVTGKFHLVTPFREFGSYWPAAIPDTERQEIIDLVDKTLDALEFDLGFAHTEVRLTPSRPRIIEVNGRLGGHVATLAHHTDGTDLVRLAGLLALGEAPAAPMGVDSPTRVSFQFHTLAPVEACAVLAVHGAAAVRRTPGICGFRPYVRPGAQLEASLRTRSLDLIWGHVPNHTDMINCITKVARTLTYDLSFATGFTSLTAATLCEIPPVPQDLP